MLERILILGLLGTAHAYAHAAPETFVRVRVMKDLPAHEFTLEGKVNRLQGLESPEQFVAIPQKQSLNVRFDEGRWIISGFKHNSLVVPGNFLAVEGEDIYLHGKKLPPKIFLENKDSKLSAIAVLPMEKYVVGVLAHEMPIHWPMESLKAQAIAARSYAHALIRDRKNKSFHLESTIMDQVYSFLSDQELKAKFERVVQAVEETRGQVLLGSNQKILKAYYHADCGGETASAKEAWSTNEEHVSVQDTYCPQNRRHNWKVSINNKEIQKKLGLNPGSMIEAIETKRFPGKIRVAQVEVKWSEGGIRSFSAAKFREVMGFFDFKSTQFQVARNSAGWTFEGKGFGHGVGLCQWGTKFLGEQGWTFQKILQHYYPKAMLQNSSIKLASLRKPVTL